jgi:hypothetical protein
MKGRLKDVSQIVTHTNTFHVATFKKRGNICPSCMKEHYPEEYKSIEMDKTNSNR